MNLMVALLLSEVAPAAESDVAFRPSSNQWTEFVQALPSATAVVLPTLVRRGDKLAYSKPSQALALELLDGVIAASKGSERVVVPEGAALPAEPQAVSPQRPQYTRQPDPSAAGVAQQAMFAATLEAVGAAAKQEKAESDYVVAMEVAFGPSDVSIVGVHTYVVDRQGQNAFSFALNGDDPMFAEASLVASDPTKASRNGLVERATQLAVSALKAQVESAQSCIEAKVAARPVSAGMLHDFESDLATGKDPYGLPMGFSAFNDPASTSAISTTTEHPPREGEAEGNAVLQLDVNIDRFAGVVHLFHDEAGANWVPVNVSQARGVSFWLYGHGTGNRLYFHLLDNRFECSRVDDAERHAFPFVDDVEGWRQVTVPFAALERLDIERETPEDGLGLDRVHGWAFGGLNSDGDKTYYIDDIELKRVLKD